MDQSALVALIVIGAIVFAIVVSVGQQGPTHFEKLAAWRERKKAIRDAGFPRDQVDQWIAEGHELCKRYAGGMLLGSLAGHEGYREDSARDMREIKDDIRAFEAAAATAIGMAVAKSTPTVTEIAQLRAEGLITADEFAAFAERFEKSPGEKASEVVAAIRDLHTQHKAGAMSQGNYHASLWTMLDRIDKDMKDRQ